MPPPAHLISKIGDPVFAIFIGLSAAVTRINREEKELGHSTKETLDSGFRYVHHYFAHIFPQVSLFWGEGGLVVVTRENRRKMSFVIFYIFHFHFIKLIWEKVYDVNES